MAEQGLKAVIYPELDDLGMREFIKQLNESLGSTSIPIGLNTESLNVNAQSSGGSGGGSVAGEVAKGTAVELSKESVKTIAEGHKQGEKDVSEDDEINDGKNKSLLTSLGGIMGTVGTVATAVGVGAIGVAGATVSIYKFLESASEPLRSVTGLFKQAFDLIWMPVGTILAVQLMPVLRDVMLKITDWMARAWDIYDQEGWSGLIRDALAMSFDVLCTLLTDAMPLFGNILGELFWEIFKRAPLGMLLQHFFGNEFWDSFEDVVNNIQDGVSKIMNIGTFVWDVFKTTQVYGWIQNIVRFLEDIWNKFTFQNISSNISKTIETVSEKGIVQTGVDLAKQIPIVGGVLSKLGLADGGVVTEPTWRFFGEAGPEAVIPLTQIGDVMNDIYGDSRYEDTSTIEKILEYLRGSCYDIWSDILTNLERLDMTANGVIETLSTLLRVDDLPNGFFEVFDDNVSQILFALNTGSTLLNEIRGVLDDETYADGIFRMLSVLNRTDVSVNSIYDILAERSQNETWLDSNRSFNQLREVSNGLTGQRFEKGNTNNITINIKGGNAMEVGEEVQRVLEKTVGKASSKMMWW